MRKKVGWLVGNWVGTLVEQKVAWLAVRKVEQLDAQTAERKAEQ